MKIFVAHSSDFDFRNKIYAPIRNSELNKVHEFFFPHETEKKIITKDTIKSCDLMICDVSMPSTGAGIEMGWANAFYVPILCTYEEGSKPSNSAKYVARKVFAYKNADDLISNLEREIGS